MFSITENYNLAPWCWRRNDFWNSFFINGINGFI